jgi:hypothetical protein
MMTPFEQAPEHDSMATFDPVSRQLVIGGRSGAQTFPHPIYPDQTITIAGGADFGIPRGLYHSDKNNFGPRFGFAWSPTSIDMVLRGGFGVFTTPEIPNPMFTFRHSAYPWVIPQTFIADATTPNIRLSDPWPDALGNGFRQS